MATHKSSASYQSGNLRGIAQLGKSTNSHSWCNRTHMDSLARQRHRLPSCHSGPAQGNFANEEGLCRDAGRLKDITWTVGNWSETSSETSGTIHYFHCGLSKASPLVTLVIEVKQIIESNYWWLVITNPVKPSGNPKSDFITRLAIEVKQTNRSTDSQSVAG